MLGDNSVGVELDLPEVELCMENSLIKFSELINIHQIKNNMSNIMGSDTSTDLTTSNVKYNLSFLTSLAKMYEDETRTGGNTNLEKAYISWSANEQYVDILSNNRLLDPAGTPITGLSSIRLFDVFHNMPTYNNYYDTWNFIRTEFGNDFAQTRPDLQHYIQPLWASILNASYLKTQSQFRNSHYQYIYSGKRLILTPQPTTPTNIWIRFKREQSLLDNTDPSTTGVNSIANAPYSNLNYTAINALSQSWIREYTLALCKEVLGWKRNKFNDQIPIPGQEVSLNGSKLLEDSNTQKDKLITQLQEQLEKLTYSNLMKDQAEMAESINKQLTYVPLLPLRG